MEWLDFSPIIRSFLSDRRMIRLESVIHGGSILLTGLASLPCPASMLKWWLNAWKQHEMVMWSCKKDRTGRRQKRNISFPQHHAPIVSCAFIMYMCMPVSDVTDIILHGHLWNKWETLCEIMAIFHVLTFVFPASLTPSVSAVIGQIQEQSSDRY